MRSLLAALLFIPTVAFADGAVDSFSGDEPPDGYVENEGQSMPEQAPQPRQRGFSIPGFNLNITIAPRPRFVYPPQYDIPYPVDPMIPPAAYAPWVSGWGHRPYYADRYYDGYRGYHRYYDRGRNWNRHRRHHHHD